MKITLKKTLVAAGMSAALLSVAACNGGRDHHRPPHHAKLFEKMDSNSDGKITKSEFSTHSDEKFSKMDIDGDGAITKEEAKQHFKSMKKKHKHKRK